MAQQTAPRLADRLQGFGDKLDAIEGQDVTLVSFDVTQRPLRDLQTRTVEDKTVVILKVANGDGEVRTFHAWSQSLADALAEVSVDMLPAVVAFVKGTSRSGLEFWTIR